MSSVFKNINEVHIEITNMCNLSCTYCYAETLLPEKHQSMNLFTNELYRTTIDKMLTSTQSREIDIVFHGGEPLLHSSEWFDEACSYACEKAKHLNKIVQFSMQSNLTILKERHIDIFKKHKVKIGVSLDGDKETHNTMRGKYDITISNIKKLQNEGLFSGVIVVISHHNYDKVNQLFALLNELNIGTFHMNIASTVGRGNPIEALGTDKTWQAWKSGIECMLQYNGKIVDTRLIKKISQFLNPPQSIQETFSQLRCDNVFCHAGVTMVAVQYDGTVSPCGCAGSSGNMKKFKLANLKETIDENPVSYFNILEQFHTKKEKYYNECVSCPAQFVCEHGCPAFDHTDPVTPENTCGATKLLYSYLNTLEKPKLQELVLNHESGRNHTEN